MEMADTNGTSSAEAARLAEIASLVAKYKMALNNKKRRTLLAMNEKAFHSFELGLIVSRCCRDMDLDGAYAAYLDANKVGVFPGAETFCNLLSLTAGLGTQGSGQALVRTQEPPHNLAAALVIYEDMLRCNVEVPEASYTALIRCSCISNEVGRGLMFFKELQRLNITPKLRSFTSLLEALGTYTTPSDPASPRIDNPIECGFEIYEQMLHKYALEPTEKEYVCMLRLCVPSADPRFYTILEAFADTGIVPVSSELRDVLKEWFGKPEYGYTITTSAVQKDGLLCVNDEKLRSLEVDERYRAEFLAQLQSFALVVDDNRKIKMNNKIKEQNKKFAEKELLRQKATESSATETVQSTTDDSNKSNTKDTADNANTHTAPAPTQTPEAIAAREAAWMDFVRYLRFHCAHSQPSADQSDTKDTAAPTKRARTAAATASTTADSTIEPATGTVTETPTATSGPSGFNIIVDGANVGYFKQNYAGAPQHVDYHQIDQLLQHLKSVGFTPLLILHCRHVSKFMIPNEKAAEVVRRWRSENCLYATPKGFNDDWFWLHAAVAHNCKVVTNDEMRDHHFQLLSPKWFNRWRERSRVQFTFGVWQDQQLAQQRRSVISGSSNSASNSAILRALQNMPVSLTSDYVPRAHPAKKNNEGGKVCAEAEAEANSGSSENGASEEENALQDDSHTDTNDADADGLDSGDVSDENSDDEEPIYINKNNKDKSNQKDKYASRRVSLRWPSPYSYSLQHIIGVAYEGYYCPPLPIEEDEAALLAEKNAYNAGVFGATSDKVKHEWLCIYRAKGVDSEKSVDNVATDSLKRKL